MSWWRQWQRHTYFTPFNSLLTGLCSFDLLLKMWTGKYLWRSVWALESDCILREVWLFRSLVSLKVTFGSRVVLGDCILPCWRCRCTFYTKEKNGAAVSFVFPTPPHTHTFWEDPHIFSEIGNQPHLVDMGTLRDWSSGPPKSTLGKWIPAPALCSAVLWTSSHCLLAERRPQLCPLSPTSHVRHEHNLKTSEYYYLGGKT